MNDRHPTELLSAYLDGEVTSAERLEVARHLDACEGCRALLDDFRTMAEAAALEPPPGAPAGMAARIVAALGSRAPARRPAFSFRVPLPLAVAAGLFMVVAGTWIVLRRQSDRQPVAVAQAARESSPPGPVSLDGAIVHPLEVERPESKSRSDRSKHPAATPAPVVEGAHPENDVASSLRSLGYIAPAPQEESAAADRSPGAAPESGPLAPKESAEAGHRAAGVNAGKLALHGSVKSETGERSIVFEFEGATGSLTEAGRLTLILEQRTCRLDVSAAPAAGEELRRMFDLASAPPAPLVARAGETKELARMQEPGVSGDAAAEAAPQFGAAPQAASAPQAAARAPAGALEKRAERSVRLIRVLSPTSRPLMAANVEQVQERLRHLLNVTARELIDSRCGGQPRQPSSGD